MAEQCASRPKIVRTLHVWIGYLTPEGIGHQGRTDEEWFSGYVREESRQFAQDLWKQVIALAQIVAQTPAEKRGTANRAVSQVQQERAAFHTFVSDLNALVCSGEANVIDTLEEVTTAVDIFEENFQGFLYRSAVVSFKEAWVHQAFVDLHRSGRLTWPRPLTTVGEVRRTTEVGKKQNLFLTSPQHEREQGVAGRPVVHELLRRTRELPPGFWMALDALLHSVTRTHSESTLDARRRTQSFLCPRAPEITIAQYAERLYVFSGVNADSRIICALVYLERLLSGGVQEGKARMDEAVRVWRAIADRTELPVPFCAAGCGLQQGDPRSLRTCANKTAMRCIAEPGSVPGSNCRRCGHRVQGDVKDQDAELRKVLRSIHQGKRARDHKAQAQSYQWIPGLWATAEEGWDAAECDAASRARKMYRLYADKVLCKGSAPHDYCHRVEHLDLPPSEHKRSRGSTPPSAAEPGSDQGLTSTPARQRSDLSKDDCLFTPSPPGSERLGQKCARFGRADTVASTNQLMSEVTRPQQREQQREHGLVADGLRLPLTELTSIKMLLSALLLATKQHDDCLRNNAAYAAIGGCSAKELNRMEMEMLGLLQYDLWIEPGFYKSFAQELSQFVDIFVNKEVRPFYAAEWDSLGLDARHKRYLSAVVQQLVSPNALGDLDDMLSRYMAVCEKELSEVKRGPRGDGMREHLTALHDQERRRVINKALGKDFVPASQDKQLSLNEVHSLNQFASDVRAAVARCWKEFKAQNPGIGHDASRSALMTECQRRLIPPAAFMHSKGRLPNFEKSEAAAVQALQAAAQEMRPPRSPVYTPLENVRPDGPGFLALIRAFLQQNSDDYVLHSPLMRARREPGGSQRSNTSSCSVGSCNGFAGGCAPHETPRHEGDPALVAAAALVQLSRQGRAPAEALFQHAAAPQIALAGESLAYPRSPSQAAMSGYQRVWDNIAHMWHNLGDEKKLAQEPEEPEEVCVVFGDDLLGPPDSGRHRDAAALGRAVRTLRGCTQPDVPMVG
eukprot:TRINITY_DN12428_c1_g1_i1.p1 TRINITY_DN12428_c1_g1~~TRINITY_DN12428_c1_g1_i1.p1  ORF type:complete len:1043 (+),score=356.57 TRINITY_DN12428_c1_g1_i1:80-3130(+)